MKTSKPLYVVVDTDGRKITPGPTDHDKAIKLACERERRKKWTGSPRYTTSDVYEAGPDGEPKTRDLRTYGGSKRDNWYPPVFRAFTRPTGWWWYRIDRRNNYLKEHRGDERVSPVSTTYSYFGQCDALRRNSPANEAHWQKMMRRKKKMSFDTFLKFVDMVPLLEDDETPSEHIANRRRQDDSTAAYASVWGNEPCLFLHTAGFEFIFLRDDSSLLR